MANNDPVLIPYVIQEGSLWYVAYKEKNPFVPEITVSAKGIANHMSEEINDGCDFGPDSYNPSVTSGVPLTQTSGIQEAWNYSIGNPINFDNPNAYSAPLHYWIKPIIIMSGAYYVYQPITVSTPIINKNGNNYYLANIYIGGMPYSDMQPYIYGMFNDEYIFTVDTTGINYCDIYAGYMQVAVPKNSSGTPVYTPSGALQIGNLTSFFPSTIQLNNINLSDTGWSSYALEIGFTNRVTTYAAKIKGINVKLSGSFQMFGGWITQNGSINSIIEAPIVNLQPNFIGGVIEIGGNTYPTSTVIVFGTDISYATPFLVNNNITTFAIENCNYSTNITTLVGVGNKVSSATIGLSIKNLSTQIANSSIGGNYTISQFIGSGISISSPTLSANPPVSGTVYQNTNPYDIEIDLPAYATTAGTAGYVTVAKGATSTPTAIGNQYVSGDTSDTSEQIIRLRVPANWYYSFTASGVTFGTASVFAE